MSSILIFIPYFGTLPEVFPFWYNSALNNPDVDFLFITDCDIKEAPNIKVRKSTLEKEKERFEKELGELIKKYDFAGESDIDGNVIEKSQAEKLRKTVNEHDDELKACIERIKVLEENFCSYLIHMHQTIRV